MVALLVECIPISVFDSDSEVVVGCVAAENALAVADIRVLRSFGRGMVVAGRVAAGKAVGMVVGTVVVDTVVGSHPEMVGVVHVVHAVLGDRPPCLQTGLSIRKVLSLSLRLCSVWTRSLVYRLDSFELGCFSSVCAQSLDPGQIQEVSVSCSCSYIKRQPLHST